MATQASTAADLLERLMAAPVGDRARMLTQTAAPAAHLASLIEHAGRMALTDAAGVDAATDVLVNLSDRMGSQLDRARARRARARALSYAGRFREALFVCEEGLRLAEEAGSAIDVGRTRLASMHALGELGRLDEAIAEGEAARRDFLAAGEPGLAARADLNIGTAHQRRDEPDIALRCFDRARPLLASEPMILGPLDNNRGEALLAVNDFAAAEAAFTQALHTFRESKAAMMQAIVEGNLADLAARQGRLQRALFHFEQARRAFEAGDAPRALGHAELTPHLARLLAEQADAKAMLGMPAEALVEYETALVALDQHGLALEAARARSGMGLTLVRLQRYAGAETALAAAATAFDELGHATARARVDVLRAELAAMNNRASDARSMAMRALVALHDRPSEAATARLLLGRLARVAGRLDEAEAELAHALALARQLDLAPLQADILHERGLLRRAQGVLNGAVNELAEAVRQVERIRGTLQADRFRAAFLGERSAMYEDLSDALLERASQVGGDDLGRALSVIEQSKGRVLLEQLQRDLTGPDGASDQNAGLLQRLHAARADLNGLYSVLGEDQPRDRQHQQHWRDMVRLRECEVDEIEARLATTAGVGVMFAATATVSEVQALLPAGAALVEYFGVHGMLGAMIVRREGVVAARRIAALDDVTRRVQALHFQVNRALRPGALEGARQQRLLEDARRELAALEALIWQPISPHVAGAQRITIVPHNTLHTVPFAALWSGDHWLVERHEFHAIPSATLLSRLVATDRQQSAKQANDSASLVVAIGDEHTPNTVAEGRLVAQMLAASRPGRPCRLLAGAQAAASAVTAQASQFSLIHFACHGRYAPGSPMGSGLRLADRWLTVRDMLDLNLNARLVTLSGCETGLSANNPGDELQGLQRSLFAAGARSILASLWRVDDAITREWMTAFYGSLHTVAGDGSVAHAVRAAQTATMRCHPHPAHWSPFTLTGLR